jgi:hypothetical protein
VALQFDIEAIAEQVRQPVATGRREGCVIGMQRQRDQAIRPPVSAIKSSASSSSHSSLICGD